MKKLFLSLLLICSIPEKSWSDELLPKPPENRFLFVVETSLSMNRSAKAAQSVVHDLIESGVQGQMNPGDTFGLWTFNQKLETTFPMQRWSPNDNKKLAQLATDFLKKQRFEKKGDLNVMLPPLDSVVKASKAITVILVSTGNEPIQGTPSDNEINFIYSTYASELRDARIPFVTILIGREGKLITHTISSSLGPIQIPNPPIRYTKVEPPAETKTTVPTTNRTPSKATNKTVPETQTNQLATASQKPLVKIETKSEIETNAVAATASTNLSTPIAAQKIEITTPAAPTSLADATPAKPEPPKAISESSVVTTIQAPASPTPITTAPTNIAEKLNPVPEETASVNSTLPDFQPKDSKASSAVVSETPSTFKPDQQGIGVPANLPKPTVRPARNKSIEHNTAPADFDVQKQQTFSAQSPPPVPVVATQPISGHKKLLSIGGSLVLVAAILAFLLFRNSRHKSEPSLISRSIDKTK